MMQSQVILVTGAARGIGRYIAGTFAKEGARLAVCDIESLDTVTIELREMGVEVLPVIADCPRPWRRNQHRGIDRAGSHAPMSARCLEYAHPTPRKARWDTNVSTKSQYC